MQKKGELSLELVIIAAILLITMALIIAFYFTHSKQLETGFSECESKRGTCVAKGTCAPQVGSPLPAFTCTKNKIFPECCLIIT